MPLIAQPLAKPSPPGREPDASAGRPPPEGPLRRAAGDLRRSRKLSPPTAEGEGGPPRVVETRARGHLREAPLPRAVRVERRAGGPRPGRHRAAPLAMVDSLQAALEARGIVSTNHDEPGVKMRMQS